MNRPDHDQPAIGRTGDGTVVFCQPVDPDIELLAALRDTLDSVDPVPVPVTAAAYQIGDLTQYVRIPQLSAFVRELLRDEALTDNTATEDQP